MKCRIDPTTESDRQYWITWNTFRDCIDLTDLGRRDSQSIEDFYIGEWFRDRGGIRYFNPPAFCLRQGKAFFINGRHRTLLLARHLQELPMALTESDARSESTLRSIAVRELEIDETFELPDLPIKGAVTT